MQVFIDPPAAKESRLLQKTLIGLRSIAPGTDLDRTMAMAGDALRDVIRFDHFLFMLPQSVKERLYAVWPPYRGNTLIRWGGNQQQDAVVFNSYHDKIVRICGKNDYGTITINVLHHSMKESLQDNFSIIFLREIVDERYLVLFGFISFKKDAYDEKDAATLFSLASMLSKLSARFLPADATEGLTPNDPDGLLGLVNLPGMQDVLKMVYKVAREDLPVLLLGESGVGKEGVSNLICNSSGRSGRPFIKINCAGIPLPLIESKLFGHVKGSFTGADKDAPGCFELAHTGTLMLDELGELPLGAQSHLLRVLQEGTIERVGSSIELPVDVRIIAATNRNLMEMVENRKFREDLFYRISLFPIYIPALRERPEDIPVLLKFMLKKESRKRGFIRPPEITTSEMRRLCEYEWPGNAREMANCVTRSILLWTGRREDPFSIQVGKTLYESMYAARSRTASTPARDTPAASRPHAEATGQPAGSLRLEDVERAHIRRVMDMTDGRVTGKGGAAELLDINPSTLRARMKKLGIRKAFSAADDSNAGS